MSETKIIKRFDKWLQRSNFSSKQENFIGLKEELELFLETSDKSQKQLQDQLTLDGNNPNLPIFHHVKEEEDLVILGYIGTAGTYLLGKYYKESLLERLPEEFVEESETFEENVLIYPSKDLIKAYDVSAVYTVSEGGLLKNLYQLGKDTGKGYRVFYKNVPIKQITVEFCEFFDMDPWRLLSCGCTIFVTSNGNKLVRKLEKDYELPAAIIGYTTKDKDKLLIHREVESRVNRPVPDELLQLLQK